MKALFVLTSPLQYVNAQEARHHFDIAPADAFAILVPSRRHPQSIVQVQRLLIEGEWAKTEILEGIPPLQLAEKPKYLREWQILQGARNFRSRADTFLKNSGSDFDAIFFGDWRARSFRYFAMQQPNADVYLLDDGSITNQAVRFRNDPRDPALENRAFPERRHHQWKLRLAGVPFYEPEKIHFFTSYQIKPTRRDEIISHSFEKLASGIASWKKLDEIWFIGSNHPENGISTMSGYLDALRRIRAFFEDSSIKYFAHRGEDAAKLDELTLMGFEVVHSELPLEVCIAQNKVYPKIIGAIASSVVDNLAAIFGSQVAILLFLAESNYYRRQKKHLQDIVRYHRRAAGGNLHTIALSSSNNSLVLDLVQRRPTYSQYRSLVEDAASISAYGAQVSDNRHYSLACQMSGLTHRPSERKNCDFPAFFGQYLPSSIPSFEKTWGTQRSTPVFRCGSRPESVGRDFWLLFEGSSQNLLHAKARSAQQSLKVAGAELRVLDAVQSVVAPGADEDAVHLIETTVDGEHKVLFPESVLSPGEPFNVSIFVKRAGRDALRLSIRQGEHLISVDFDLSGGRVIESPQPQKSKSSPDCAPSIEKVAEQWFRVAFRTSSVSNLPIQSEICLLKADQILGRTQAWSSLYPGDGFSGAYLQYPQLAKGWSVARPVPHCPGKTGPRPADSLLISPAPDEGKPSSSSSFLMVMKVAHAAEGGEEAPVLTILRAGESWLSCCLRPDRVRVSGPGLVGAEVVVPLAPRVVQNFGLTMGDGGRGATLAVNGYATSIALRATPGAEGPPEFQVGGTGDSYFHFLVEELRIAKTEVSSADLSEITRPV